MAILKNQKLDETIVGGAILVESKDKYPFDLKKATLLIESGPVQPEGGAVLCSVVYPICNIGELNANKRIYDKPVFERVLGLQAIIDSIKGRSLFGHAEHPEGMQSKTPLISHVHTKFWMDESRVYQEYDVLDTPEGRIVDCLLRAKCNIGVSTRAEGDLMEDVDGKGGRIYRVIPEAYNYRCTDFTADPSTFGVVPLDIRRGIVATIKKELENKETKAEEKQFAVGILESFKCEDKSKCQHCGCCGIKVNEDAEGEDWPQISNLDKSDVEKLAKITGLKNVEVIDEWVDDHLPCISIKFTDQSGNKWRLSLWWIDSDVVASAKFADDSVRARNEFVGFIVANTKDMLENPKNWFDDNGKSLMNEPKRHVVKTNVDVLAMKKTAKSKKVAESRLSVDDVKKIFKSIDPAFAKHLTGLMGSEVDVAKRGKEVGLELTPYGAELLKESKVAEGQVTMVAGGDGSVAVTGDVKKIIVDPQVNTEVPGRSVDVTVMSKEQQTATVTVIKQEAIPPMEPPAVPGPAIEPQAAEKEEAGDTSDDEVELKDEDFDEEYDVDEEDMEESKANETKEIKKLYTSKGLKPPKGKGIHTKAFHKCATNYASKIKGGRMTKQDAYKRCMGGLGKKRAVKKSHQRNETVDELMTYIGEMLNETKDLIFVDETGFSNDKFGVFRKPMGGNAYLTFSFPTREKAVELGKSIAIMLEAEFSETKPEGVTVESKQESAVIKDVIDLQVNEAVARAERDLAVESLKDLSTKGLENKILMRKIQEARGTETALREAVEKKSETANDLMAKSKEVINHIERLEKELAKAKDEAKKIADKLQAQVDKLTKEKEDDQKAFDVKMAQAKSGAAESAVAEAKKAIVKEYVTKGLGNIKVSDDQRALLESCQTIAEADKALDECVDIARRRALHTGPVTKVVVKERKVEEKSPQLQQQQRIVTGILKK